MPGSFRSMPVKISSPSPPPPIRNASGAVPTLTASAVRMPGEHHEQRVRQLDAAEDLHRPHAHAGAPPRRRCAGTPSMPAYVLRTIGSSDATHKPKIAGTTPMPSRLIASASTASVGIVLPRLSACMIVSATRAHPRAGSATARAERRRRSRGRPEIATSFMCCRVRNRMSLRYLPICVDQAAALRDDAERERDDERDRRHPPPRHDRANAPSSVTAARCRARDTFRRASA